MIVEGVLEDFWETGTEGIIWSVHDETKEGYDGLFPIDVGDELTIYNNDGTIKWSGIIDPDYKVGYLPYPLNPKYGQQASCGRWVHWIQKGFTPDAWGESFFQYNPRLRAKLVKKISRDGSSGS